MKRILVLDEKNYDESMEEIYRVAVRGIIFLDGKLLLQQSSLYNEMKLPGGGMEGDETEIETLIREVREETGYNVIPDTVRAFGEVEEKRLASEGDIIWHQINRYYFCEVSTHDRGEIQLTENEKKHGFQTVTYTIDEAIAANEAMQKTEGVKAHNKRELAVFRMIKEEAEK